MKNFSLSKQLPKKKKRFGDLRVSPKRIAIYIDIDLRDVCDGKQLLKNKIQVNFKYLIGFIQ